MNHCLTDAAQNLLSRSLLKSEGLLPATIATAEERMGIDLPVPLHELYQLVGNQPLFMQGFQQIYKPDELLLQDGKLIFMEENQGVCYWAIGTDFNNLAVYQCTDLNEGEWYEEEIALEAFLVITLYYQFLQVNSHRQRVISLTHLQGKQQKQQFIDDYCKGLTKIADHNGLVIYDHPQKLIWYYRTENEGPFEEICELLTTT